MVKLLPALALLALASVAHAQSTDPTPQIQRGQFRAYAPAERSRFIAAHPNAGALGGGFAGSSSASDIARTFGYR